MSTKTGKVWAVKGNKRLPVKIVHWWQGRKFKDMDRTEWMGNSYKRRRYVTMAYVMLPEVPTNDFTLFAVAQCNKKDNPIRAYGRRLALARLSLRIGVYGWVLADDDNTEYGEAFDCVLRPGWGL